MGGGAIWNEEETQTDKRLPIEHSGVDWKMFHKKKKNRDDICCSPPPPPQKVVRREEKKEKKTSKKSLTWPHTHTQPYTKLLPNVSR